MNSSRLPGKVLAKIGDETMLAKQITRLKNSRYIGTIVVATTEKKEDDEIEAECQGLGVGVFRGEEQDVLRRIARCAQEMGVPHLLEVFGDSPLIDPKMVDDYYEHYLTLEDGTILTNSLRTTYPPGLEITICSFQSLQSLDDMVGRKDPLREHVCSNFRRFPEHFSIVNIDAPEHLRRPDIFLEVDEIPDLQLVRAIFRDLESSDSFRVFDSYEILSWTSSNQELIAASQSVVRRWKSFREDVDLRKVDIERKT